MRLGLRTRLMAACTLAALVPMAITGLWARSVLVEVAEEAHARREASVVVSARDRLAHRLREDAQALRQACARDAGLGAAGGILMVGDGSRLGGQLRDERLPARHRAQVRARFGAEAAALRDLLRMDTVEVRVVRAEGHTPGAVLGAAPAPLGDGQPDPGLVATAIGAQEAFVLPRATEGTTRSLVHACRWEKGETQLALLGTRTLDEAFVRDLLGDITPIHLEAPDTPGSHEGTRLVHTFRDAQGAPAVRVVTAPEATQLATQLARLDQGFAIAGVGAVALALLLGALLALATTRPLRELERAAVRVGRGDLESTIGDVTGGEVGNALEAFNHMTRELKRTRARLLRAERIAAWRDIARRIAHEIKNPLSPIQMSIETMRKTYTQRHPEFDEIFEESTLAILEEVERLKRIVSEFSRFARMPRPRPEALDVAEVAGHVVGFHRDGPVRVRLTVEPTPPVQADREQITQVLTNLVQNALDACRARHGDDGGRVDVWVGPSERGRGTDVVVDDDGPGIPPAERERIFEPYHTTKERGTGLGLAIVHRIVLDHGGDIEVGASPIGGARLRLWLPPEGPPSEADASQTDTAMPLVTRRGGDG